MDLNLFKIICRTCVSACPPRSYADSQNICEPCHEACETCSGPTQKHCLSCSPGHVRVIDLDICLQQCPEGYFESKFLFAKCTSSEVWIFFPFFSDYADKTCTPCHPNCNGCQDHPDHCTSCDHHLLLYQNKCLATCPPNTYETDDYT